MKSFNTLLLTAAVIVTSTAGSLFAYAAWAGANPPPASGVGAERMREIHAEKEAAAWAARDAREVTP